ncbi:MAG: CHAT domain-containing protein [Nevskia sp.]|nr:CHAT domain-containing protein [Nevskia sp.]
MAAADPPPVDLAPGTAVRDSVGAGQERGYRIALAAGQAARLTLRQLDDHAPELLWTDAPDLPPLRVTAGRRAFRSITLVAAAASAWRFRLAAKTKGNPASYEVVAGPAHPATDADRRMAAAETALARADDLRQISGSSENGSRGGDEAVSRARAAYAEASAAWRQAADDCGLRRTYSGLGRLRYAHDDYRGAIDAERNALAAGCDDSADPGLTADTAEAYRTLGASLSYLGDFADAIVAKEKALSLYEQTGDDRFRGVVLGNLSSDAAATGQSAKALDAAESALRLAEAAGDRQGIEFSRERVAAMLLSRGELGPSLELYQRTLEELRQAPYPMVENMAWNDLGLLYRELGDPAQSRAAYEKAQAAALANDDRSAVVEALRNQGNAALDAAELDGAARLFRQSLDLSRQGGFRSFEGAALLGLGRCALASGDWTTAAQRLHAATGLARRSGDVLTGMDAQLALGDLDSRRGRWASARARYAGAYAAAVRTHSSNLLPVTLASLARSEKSLGERASARRHIERALALIEAQRLRINDPSLRTSYFNSRRGYYELYIDILMEMQRRNPAGEFAATALEASERARARTLQDMLLERRLSLERPVDARLLEEERAADDRLHLLAYQAARETDGAARARLQNEVDEASRRLDELRGRIRGANPRYAELSNPQGIATGEIQRLLGPGTALLEYWLGEERSYLWLVTRDTLASYVLPPRGVIEGPAEQLRMELSAGRIASADVPIEALPDLEAANLKSVQTLGRSLGRQLLGPAAALARYGTVIVVGDGALQRLPFNMLDPAFPVRPTGAQEFFYLPSIASARWLRGDTTFEAPSAVAIMADPVFSRSDPRIGAQAVAAEPGGQPVLRAAVDAGIADLPRLAYSRVEAQNIAALLPGKSTWVVLDFAASRDNALRAAWSDYPAVHFATHALLDLRHPELSGIVLSLYNQAGQPQDGFLRMNDIYNLRIPAELVFLSACESALGRSDGEEGVYSLSRAFFYAGTKRVLANLWPVDDRASAEFVERFYRALLLRHRNPGQALRAAQDEMSNDPRWRRPYYWAGYVLQGDWR